MFRTDMIMLRLPGMMAVVLASSLAAAGDPALLGHHALTQAQAGSVLLGELRCAACHEGTAPGAVPEKSAPDLKEVGQRVSADYLRQFLTSPQKTHPGTTMPDMLAGDSDADRSQIAEALTHFLVASSTAVSTKQPVGSIDRQLGQSLFHSIGCVACHGPQEARDTPAAPNPIEEDEDEVVDPVQVARKLVKPNAVPLGHVRKKYSIGSLSDFLFQPLKVRSSGRMPDMKLTPAESLAIAGYLIGEPAPPEKALVPDPTLIEQGRKHFQALNCAACHALPGFQPARPVVSLAKADWSRGCLSQTNDAKPGVRAPRFGLPEEQRQAIVSAIPASPMTEPESDKITLAKTLTAFRCVACHIRDGYGGVHDAHNSYFAGSELKLGDDGRIPPPLTLVGAKLQPAWLKKVLFDGETVRHYMATRMPQYGTANLQHLPPLLSRLDVMDGPEMKLPSPESRNDAERQREKQLRAAGRELLGDKGVNCVACHNFNGKAAHTNQGIDLLTSYERLQPQWFNSYLRNPGAFRPRTVMPTAWPDGRAAFRTILDGDTDRQIEAIWYYLSLGTSAADPSGIRSVSTKLAVTDHARTFRGRSRVAGFRGIAVGLPEKLSYAFNAETGTLSALWRGDFIGVNWNGQGSGDFNPASEPIALAQDVSFVQLADENSPWPLKPVMTKEAKLNPNPLYPKNVGYQFGGYFLDEASVPTFMYRCGSIGIEDRSEATGSPEAPQLKRVLRFDSPAPQTVWFRALTGEIHQESERIYRSGRLRLTIPATVTKLRVFSAEPQQQELLLRLEIPQGQSSQEMVYEPLDK